MVFDNVLGGILGGLAGGTALSTAQTNYVGMGWLSAGPIYYIQGYTPATNWQTAQWIGNIQSTVTINTPGMMNFAQAFFDIPLQSTPNIWVPAFTPEELKAMELAEEKRRIEREAAKTAATELLCSSLDREQLEQFKRDGHFDVKIAVRVYRITPGRKVRALHEKQSPYLCIAPYGHELPNEDVALAQKLLLEANEKEFLKTAIRWAA